MQDGFEKWGVDYVSHSSLTCWVEQPALWVIRYLVGVKSVQGDAAVCGQIIEDAVHHGLSEPFTEAETWGDYAFDRWRAHLKSEDPKDVRSLIIFDMVVSLIDLYRRRGPLLSYQRECFLSDPEIPVPLKVVLDFEFEDGVSDLKTTTGSVKGLTWTHRRQASLQAIVSGKRTDFTYAILQKNPRVIESPLVDPEPGMAEVRHIAKRLNHFLLTANSIEDACLLTTPDPNYRYWDAPTIEARRQYYGY